MISAIYLEAQDEFVAVSECTFIDSSDDVFKAAGGPNNEGDNSEGLLKLT